MQIDEQIDNGEQLGRQSVFGMKRATWEPAPRNEDQHIPIDIDDVGFPQEDDHEQFPTETIDDEELPNPQLRMNRDKLSMSRTRVQK